MNLKLKYTILIALVTLTASTINAQAWQSRSNLTASEFQEEFNELVSQGYGLVSRNICNTANGLRYAGIFEKINVTWQSWSGRTAEAFDTLNNDLIADGYVPTFITGYNTSGGTRYAGIWQKQSNKDVISNYGMTSAEYQLFFNESVANGYVLNQVDGYYTNEGHRYAAIFEKRASKGFQSWSNMTSSTLEARFNELTPQDYVITHIDGYNTDAGIRYLAIWEKKEVNAFQVRNDLTFSQTQATVNELVPQGYKLTTRSMYNTDEGIKYAFVFEK